MLTSHSTRSLVRLFLWGSAVEHCSECGVEIMPSTAYRVNVREVYCCPEHAARDGH